MKVTIVSSLEFDQDIGAAKRAASRGPVFITDRGRPAHVLLTIERYEAMSVATGNITGLLGMPGVAEIGFEAPRVTALYRSADLS